MIRAVEVVGFFLLMLLLVIFCYFLTRTVRQKFGVSDRRVPVVEGALDYDTGQFLESQRSFISRLDTLIETSFPAQGASEEDGESEWQVNFDRLKLRLRHMESLDVAELFLAYKAEVNENFSHAVSVIENMLETDSYDEKVLIEIRLALEELISKKSEELPALLDALGLEYTFETDENGNEVISYYYTVLMP